MYVCMYTLILCMALNFGCGSQWHEQRYEDCMCMYVCMYVHIFMYMYIYVCIYVCTYFYVYVYTCMHVCMQRYEDLEKFNVSDASVGDMNTSTSHADAQVRRQDVGSQGQGDADSAEAKEGKKRGRSKKDAGSPSSRSKTKTKPASPGGGVKEGQSLMTRFFAAAPKSAIVGGGELEQG